MKILFVIDTLDTNNNGTSISAQRFAKELNRRGHEVRILCADPQETDENGVALPVEVTGKYIVPEYVIPLFNPLAKKHGFTYGDFLPKSRPIIHEAVEWADVVHTFFPFPLDMVASSYAAKIGKPNTGAFHVQPENITSSLGCGKVQWVQNMIYRLFRNTHYYKYRHIHVPSAFMGRMIEERGYKAKIHVISNGIPVVFLHGYGQTRTGWQATPDGREGWSDLFLKKGYSVFLVDQPRRGAAAATEMIVTDPGDVEDGKFKVGEQAWYTHFRIGRVAPERYEGSQFPAGDKAQTQFFCQMTPNTGNYDEPLFGQAMSAVMSDVQKMTGKKAVYITHSQGGRVGWQTDTENIAAIVAIEPGFAPMVGSPEYQKFVEAKVPMLFLFGDNIMNGPEDIQSTGFWQMVLNQCRDFAEHYNQDGGDATVIHLPDMGIKGNSHFMFQEMNNVEIADIVADWLNKHNL